MKRNGLLILAVFIFFSGCYDSSDKAKVKINLGNLPVAQNVHKKSVIDRLLAFISSPAYAQSAPGDLVAVHIGAFDKNNLFLASESIDIDEYPSNNTVEFEVPAGDNRTIVVLGETTTEESSGNIIYYYGKADTDINGKTLNLEAGGEATVQISMDSIDSFVSITTSVGLSRMEWDAITGASGYNVYDSDYNLLQSGTERYFVGSNSTYYYLETEFDFINKTTSKISHYMGS